MNKSLKFVGATILLLLSALYYALILFVDLLEGNNTMYFDPGKFTSTSDHFFVKSVVKACQAERPASTLWGFLDVRFIAPVNWQVATGKPHEKQTSTVSLIMHM